MRVIDQLIELAVPTVDRLVQREVWNWVPGSPVLKSANLSVHRLIEQRSGGGAGVDERRGVGDNFGFAVAYRSYRQVRIGPFKAIYGGQSLLNFVTEDVSPALQAMRSMYSR